jgi:copper transport protein
MRVSGWPLRSWIGIGALTLLLSIAALGIMALSAPVAKAQRATPSRPLHALLLRSDPAANAILAAPPSQVRAWFSEAVNPDSSSLVVIDPANHEVDTRDSHVSASDPTELVIGLQLLRPGTYVVIWRTQSQDDGHITGSSFIFRVANADGSVPPVPATLPTSATPGAAGYGVGNTTLDGPTTIQAFFTWLALLFLTFWVGGVIWETWVAPATAADASAAEGVRLAAARFRRLAPYALGGLLLANVGLAAALTVEIAGSPRGLIIAQFWRATLFSGQFGAYWWMRQAVALAALILAVAIPTRSSPLLGDQKVGAVSPPLLVGGTPRVAGLEGAGGEVSPWTQELLATLRQVPRLPRRLMRGWLGLSLVGRVEVALGGLLLFAFAMSGHAAATAPSERAYAVSVDLLHLIFTAAWLGGLLYISAVLVPAARALEERASALALARGVPAFSALAIVSAAFLSLTGSLNATVRLTSASQLITTTYGRILTVKVEIFLVMVAISAYHAFHLRPRLARALATAAVSPRAAVIAGSAEQQRPQTDQPEAPETASTVASGVDEPLTPLAGALAARLTDWLRREALLGGGVLLCVALLGVFAGTLAPTQATAPVNTSAYLQSQTISGYKITLQVAPAAFGSNTFTVTVTDAQGKPAREAGVLLLTDSLDMDMGEGSLQLKPTSQPGVYSGVGDLTMSGHWRITVKVLPHGASDYLVATFALLAGAPSAAPISGTPAAGANGG